MNYRHAFHAGNFADVFKHALLTRILVYLMRKEQPLRFIDTHGGIGRYDLASDEAARTGEWRDGIARIVMATPPEDVAALLKPWLDAVGPCNAVGCPENYPGSPALAQGLLRPQDRIAVSELHEQDFHALRRALARFPTRWNHLVDKKSRQNGNGASSDRKSLSTFSEHALRDERLRLAQMDGYAALNAWTPPRERRGLVLIDPPFESREEFEAILSALGKAWRKWPTGCYAIWYPLKAMAAVDAFYDGLAMLGIERILRVELATDRPDAAGPLAANGLCVINPPFVLKEEAEALLPWLCERLARSPHASWRVAGLSEGG